MRLLTSKSVLAGILSVVFAASTAYAFQKPKSNPGNSGNAPGQNKDSNAGGNGATHGNAGGNGANNGNPGGKDGDAGGQTQTQGQNGNTPAAKLQVIWGMSGSEVAQALQADGSVTVPFQVTGRIENAGFWLTPSLRPYLTVLTEPFAVLEPDTEYEVDLAWKEAPPEKTVGGTLHLVPEVEGEDGLRRTYAKPLPVNVKPAGVEAEEEGEEPALEEEVLTIVNSLTYEGPPIAPLQIVSIYGFGIGPEEFQPSIIENGKITDYLADVQVLFDGTAAPIIYASETELKVVVPSNVAGKETVTLTVTYQDKIWEVTDVPVVEASPEIFSMNGLGHGVAIAYDSDGNAINEENPVQPGEIITFFGNGVGLWKDGFIDGTIVDPENLPVPKKPVEVLIGGTAAKLLYVGGAAGLVNAIVQFTVEVPAEFQELDETTTPPSAAIVVTTAGHSSKAEVFIYVGEAAVVPEP